MSMDKLQCFVSLHVRFRFPHKCSGANQQIIHAVHKQRENFASSRLSTVAHQKLKKHRVIVAFHHNRSLATLHRSHVDQSGICMYLQFHFRVVMHMHTRCQHRVGEEGERETRHII